MIKNQVKTLEDLVEEYKERKVNYSTYEFDDLSYRTLILDIHTMLKENQKYKEVINKALKLNEKIINMREQGYSYEQYKPYLLRQQNILKEVEHE